MTDGSISLPGRRDAPDLLGLDNGKEIFLGAHDDPSEPMIGSTLDYDQALKLGEWLIAHAIAGGAERQAA